MFNPHLSTVVTVAPKIVTGRAMQWSNSDVSKKCLIGIKMPDKVIRFFGRELIRFSGKEILAEYDEAAMRTLLENLLEILGEELK